jgi:hypothetical protein
MMTHKDQEKQFIDRNAQLSGSKTKAADCSPRPPARNRSTPAPAFCNCTLEAWLADARPLADDVPEFMWPSDMRDLP